MPNINIVVPDELHKDLKIEAARKDSTLKDLIITILEANAGKKAKKLTGERRKPAAERSRP
jgi:hypothetical protein